MLKRILYGHEAINEATHQVMQADKSVIVIGEGVPDPKRIFNTTSGLVEKFGKDRVFDSPLSENAVTGICIGASMNGMRPILIHQRVDFSFLSFDQIINNAAKMNFMFNGNHNSPLVIRLIVGRGWGQGPQHSQNIHTSLSCFPGIKIVMPSNPYDAKGLLISSVEDNNPLIFIEHRWMHYTRNNVPKSIYRIPIGKASFLSKGKDVTILSYSHHSNEILKICNEISKISNFNFELIDLRSLVPLDCSTIGKSIKKTGKLIIYENQEFHSCFSGEILKQITEKVFDSLTKPPLLISGPRYPVPTSHYLSKYSYVDSFNAAKKIIKFMGMRLSEKKFKDLNYNLEINTDHDKPNVEFTGPF